MTIIDKKRIEAALQEAKDKQRRHEFNPMSEASIDARAAVDCYEFVLKNCKEFDGLDNPFKLEPTKANESIYPDDGIDYNNTEELVKDIWLFLTNEQMPDEAIIKREAFFHEVGAMLDTIRSVSMAKVKKENSVVMKEFLNEQLKYVKRAIAIKSKEALDENSGIFYKAGLRHGYEITMSMLLIEAGIPELPVEMQKWLATQKKIRDQANDTEQSNPDTNASKNK